MKKIIFENHLLNIGFIFYSIYRPFILFILSSYMSRVISKLHDRFLYPITTLMEGIIYPLRQLMLSLGFSM